MNRNFLYYFNPGHEGAILNGSPYYMAPANVATMQQELAYLVAWYANSNDTVLTQEILPLSFTEIFSQNIVLPTAVTPSELAEVKEQLSIHLWGISPQAIHYFEYLNNKHSLNLTLPIWNHLLKDWSSREFAKNCLRKLLVEIPTLSKDLEPQFYSDLNIIEKKVSDSDFQLLAKAPYSSSGRGLLWLPKGGLTQTERQILHGIIKKQGHVSLEKALDKKLDFAMEFNLVENDSIEFIGFSLFETNSKGGYLGNHITSQKNILDKITQHINVNILDNVKYHLMKILNEVFPENYIGCIGVDMLIYEEEGENKLHPCVEINIRDNMGLLAIKLHEKHIHMDSYGYFRINFSSRVGEIYNQHKTMQEQYPLSFNNNKIYSGYFPLCPVSESSKCHAYVILETMASAE